MINEQDDETLTVRDGIVSPRTFIWWRCEEGPEFIYAKDHWGNIELFPEHYQLEEPNVVRTFVKYLE